MMLPRISGRVQKSAYFTLRAALRKAESAGSTARAVTLLTVESSHLRGFCGRIPAKANWCGFYELSVDEPAETGYNEYSTSQTKEAD